MIEHWNTMVLDLHTPVLIRDKEGSAKAWTLGKVTGIKVNEHRHEHCGGRGYNVAIAGTAHENRFYSRCAHWIIPADPMGRWVGQILTQRAELQLCWYDHVTNGDGIAYVRSDDHFDLELRTPADDRLLASVRDEDLVEWAVQGG